MLVEAAATSTYRVLLSRQGAVQLRCTYHIPAPLYALVLGTLEHEDLEEYGPIVVSTVTLHEQHTPGGVEGSFEVHSGAGTLEDGNSLPILPPVDLRWKNTHEA